MDDSILPLLDPSLSHFVEFFRKSIGGQAASEHIPERRNGEINAMPSLLQSGGAAALMGFS